MDAGGGGRRARKAGTASGPCCPSINGLVVADEKQSSPTVKWWVKDRRFSPSHFWGIGGLLGLSFPGSASSAAHVATRQPMSHGVTRRRESPEKEAARKEKEKGQIVEYEALVQDVLTHVFPPSKPSMLKLSATQMTFPRKPSI
jgi:hypothetical protein